MRDSSRPRVSVIATVYRRTEYLQEALASVLAQRLDDYEVIVTDDSASDALRAICARMGDARIRYRSNARPLGVALNVRSALEEARGTYVAILNDDDAWEPGFLDGLAAALDADERRVVAFCDHWIMDARGVVDAGATDACTRRFHRDRLAGGDHADALSLVLRWNAVPLAMAGMFRRDAFAPSLLVPEVVGAYDFWIAVQLAALGRPFHYVPARLTRYRTHEAMETVRRAPDKSENAVFVFRALLADARLRAHVPLLRARLADALIEAAKDRLRFDQLAAARRQFLESCRLRPSKRAAAGWVLTFAPRRVRQSLGLASTPPADAKRAILA